MCWCDGGVVIGGVGGVGCVGGVCGVGGVGGDGGGCGVLVLVGCFMNGPTPVWVGVLVCWWCVP